MASSNISGSNIPYTVTKTKTVLLLKVEIRSFGKNGKTITNYLILINLVIKHNLYILKESDIRNAVSMVMVLIAASHEPIMRVQLA